MNLLPCHNCKSTNVILDSSATIDFVKCKHCGFEGPGAWDNANVAIKQWNFEDIYGETGSRANFRIELLKDKMQEWVNTFRKEK